MGQALFERIAHDDESGQILTASFMDYAMPRADDLPSIEVHGNHHPTPANPLGVTHLDMPLTPERVWAAIRAARGG